MSISTGYSKSLIDLRLRTLRCRDMLIIDRDCNVNIQGIARVTNLTAGEMVATGNIVACNEMRGKEKLVLGGDVLVQGSLFCGQDEFTTIFTHDGNATNEIPVLDGLLGSTLMMETCPCLGNIANIDPSSGNVRYQLLTPGLDMYRYSAQDECGVRHSVTQLVCARGGSMSVIPPMLNNGCANQGDGRPPLDHFGAILNLADTAVVGDLPIDWNTIMFKNAEIYTTGPGNSLSCNPLIAPPFQIVNAPYGTNDSTFLNLDPVQSAPNQFTITASPFSLYTGSLNAVLEHLGGGMVQLQFQNVDWSPSARLEMEVYIRVEISVADTAGNFSNCAQCYFGQYQLV